MLGENDEGELTPFSSEDDHEADIDDWDDLDGMDDASGRGSDGDEKAEDLLPEPARRQVCLC